MKLYKPISLMFIKMYCNFTVDEHYNGNRSRNAIVRQDLPAAKEEQEREIREAELRYCAFVKEQ